MVKLAPMSTKDKIKYEKLQIQKQKTIDSEIGRQRTAGETELHISPPEIIYLRKKKTTKSKSKRKSKKK